MASKYERFKKLEVELEEIANRISEIGEELADMRPEPELKRMALRAGNTEPQLLRKMRWLFPENERVLT